MDGSFSLARLFTEARRCSTGFWRSATSFRVAAKRVWRSSSDSSFINRIRSVATLLNSGCPLVEKLKRVVNWASLMLMKAGVLSGARRPLRHSSCRLRSFMCSTREITSEISSPRFRDATALQSCRTSRRALPIFFGSDVRRTLSMSAGRLPSELRMAPSIHVSSRCRLAKAASARVALISSNSPIERASCNRTIGDGSSTSFRASRK